MKKKRSPIHTARWVVVQASYRRVCEDIAYRGGYKLMVRDGIIYKVDNGVEVVLIRPMSPKSLWFEAWCALTGQIDSVGP